ncbi:hypothetical protein F5X98DRAFT_366593 [Xylaria grammica]|nr:hypothetical protein F5X98DRAFT_366593 [Xylaria grammica]
MFNGLESPSGPEDLLGLLAGSRNLTATILDPLLNPPSNALIFLRILLDDTAASGFVNCTEHRLYTRAVALWAMVGLLAFAPCLAIVTVVYTKQGSLAIGNMLKESSEIRLSKICKTLANYDFVLVWDRARMPRIKKHIKRFLESKLKRKRPWMPYSSRRHAIAAFESLWYLSKNSKRFVTILSDFSISTSLAARAATVDRTIFFTIVENLLLAALLLVASTIGSLLTIAVFGLWLNSGNDSLKSALPCSDTTRLFNDLAHGGYDKARLIWSNLSETVNNSGSTLQYNIAVPAVWPFLKCSVLPHSSVGQSEATNFTYTYYAGDGDVILSSNPTSSEGCPSLGAMFGEHKGVDRTRLNITALICTQRLQLVNANVTYSGHSSSLSPSLTAVHLNPSTPRNATDAGSGSSSLHSLNEDFDPFFQYLVYGPRGSSAENFLGSRNDFMVCVVDLEWRSSIDSENTTQSISEEKVAKGTATATVSRLTLNKTSRIILEAFLSTMVLLGGLAYWCIDMRILPRNPYPVASSIALLAGSRLIEATTQGRLGSGEQEPFGVIKRKRLVILKGDSV